MKSKFRNLLLAAIAVSLFAGCTNIASNDAIINGGTVLPDQCLVTVGVGETFNEVGARTINPGTTYSNTSVFKKLELTGTSAKGAPVSHTFTATELTAKQATVSLTYDKWYLTLVAYDGADTASAVPVLKGEYFADLTNQTLSNIEFTLSPDGVDQSGSVELTLQFFDPYKSVADRKIDKVEAGLYKIENNQLYSVGTTDSKMETTDTAFTLSNLIVTSSDPTAPNTKCTFTANGLAVEPGRYMFKIWFKTSSGRKAGFYSDVVVVAPGRKTEQTVTVPDVMERIPEKPEQLKVLLVEGSENNGFYKAHIKWLDKSTNEESFVLKVTEWDAYTTTDADSPTSTKIYGVEENTANNKYYFWGSDFRADGTLGTSTTSCEVNLKLGVLYDFEIAAWNSCGISDFEKRTACVASDDVEATSSTPALTGYTTSYNTSKVNRYKIDYDLSSGKLEKSATESYEGTYTEFKTYAGAAITLQAGNPATGATYPKVTRSNNPFVDWYYKPSATAAATTISTYNSWNNLSVWASYDPTYIISYVVDESYGDLADTDVTATADIGGTSAVNCKNAILDLTAAGATNPVFTFTVAGAEEVKVIFGDKANRTNTGTTVELNTTGSTVTPGAIDPLEGKTYCVTVLALKQLTGDTAARWYSKVFAVTIKR